MTRRDVAAMRTYLSTLAPIKNKPPRNELLWPLNNRVLMRGWNWLNFQPGEFVPQPDKSAEWNRGAYLVEGPGHCGACHTPKTLVGGDKTSEALQGAAIQDWTAPALVGDDRAGLGRWSVEDIVEYLKTGRNKFSGAAGLMAEVVKFSTSKLTAADLRAIAVYLKDQPGKGGDETAKGQPDAAVMRAGGSIYNDSCAGCHTADGEGVARMFPPLKGDAVAQQDDPTTVVRVILDGARTVATDARPTPFAMPAFAWKLSDEQVAAVATYVRNSWGNAAPAVTADTVRKLRKNLDSAKPTPETMGTAPKQQLK
jgi:mono/diheme cytochrome c family protein